MLPGGNLAASVLLHLRMGLGPGPEPGDRLGYEDGKWLLLLHLPQRRDKQCSSLSRTPQAHERGWGLSGDSRTFPAFFRVPEMWVEGERTLVLEQSAGSPGHDHPSTLSLNFFPKPHQPCSGITPVSVFRVCYLLSGDPLWCQSSNWIWLCTRPLYLKPNSCRVADFQKSLLKDAPEYGDRETAQVYL